MLVCGPETSNMIVFGPERLKVCLCGAVGVEQAVAANGSSQSFMVFSCSSLGVVVMVCYLEDPSTQCLRTLVPGL